jgi:hypothetical protein
MLNYTSTKLQNFSPLIINVLYYRLKSFILYSTVYVHDIIDI